MPSDMWDFPKGIVKDPNSFECKYTWKDNEFCSLTGYWAWPGNHMCKLSPGDHNHMCRCGKIWHSDTT